MRHIAYYWERRQRYVRNAQMAYLKKVALLTILLSSVSLPSFASSVGLSGLKDVGSGVGSIDWPWTKFLYSLAEQFTGPIPLILGIFGMIGAGFALFTGQASGTVGTFIKVIFGVAACLFAPSFINYIMISAGGVTIYGI